MQASRWHGAWWRNAATLAMLMTVNLLVSACGASPAPADAWSTIGTFHTRDGWFASPIHATLLPDGRVFFIGTAYQADPPNKQTPSRRIAWIFSPPPIGTNPSPETIIDEIAEPVEYDNETFDATVVNDDLYCTATTLMADGRLFTAGGSRAVHDASDGSYKYTTGLPYQTVFDGSTWQRVDGEMVGIGALGTNARWYPTLTRLPDGKLLVTGGLELVTAEKTGTPNPTLETYDPGTGARAVVSDAQQTPSVLHARDYTHVFVLPYADAPRDLLLLGDAGVPLLTSTTAPDAWVRSPAVRPGPADEKASWGSSSVMLPIRSGDPGYRNGTVLVAGGAMHTPYEHQADTYDPTTGTWGASIGLGTRRHHPSAVVLADSRVLLVNGHDMNGGTAVQQAQYIDPSRGSVVTTSNIRSGVTRGYHSMAILLPDGRVLVGGGRGDDTETSFEKPTYQLYTPDYGKRSRPTISSAPSELAYGQPFSLTTAGEPAEVMLMALGSMTHSFDNSQRVVQLPIASRRTDASGASVSIIGSPGDAHVAPPGFYQLVVLDANRTPSSGRIVHVRAAPPSPV